MSAARRPFGSSASMRSRTAAQDRDLLVRGVGSAMAEDAVQEVVHARDRRDQQQASGAQHATRLRECGEAVGGGGQVIERAEHEHRVEWGVVLPSARASPRRAVKVPSRAAISTCSGTAR